MKYKWKPNATQRREFAERMKDPDEQKAYSDRKIAKNTYSNNPLSFKHKSFIPTETQYKHAQKMFLSCPIDNPLTIEQRDACNQVIYGYSCQEKVHHDYIHIINEHRRNEIGIQSQRENQ